MHVTNTMHNEPEKPDDKLKDEQPQNIPNTIVHMCMHVIKLMVYIASNMYQLLDIAILINNMYSYTCT